MTNNLQQIAALLLEHRDSGTDWGKISSYKRGECPKRIANRFLICCLLDWQWDADLAWKRGEHLADELEKRGDPDDLWARISSFSKEEWDSKYEEFGRPHRFHRGYQRLWSIANDMCTRYEGDARNIWSGKSSFETLVHLWALGAGDQISRMIVGALRDCDQIEGDSGDVKADLHLRRVLGRAVYGEEIRATEAAKVIQLTRNLNADPWKLDLPLWNIGKSYCRPTSPNCPNCYLRLHCVYYQQHHDASTSGDIPSFTA